MNQLDCSSLFIFQTNTQNMKNNLFILMISCLIASCSTSNTHPDYQANLATAKKLFALHAEENYDEQVKLVSKDIVSQPAIYGVDKINYEGYCQMIKGYHAAFDDIKYTADYWLPGTDTLGNIDGSVRTYGTWTGIHTATQKTIVAQRILVYEL